MSVRVVTANIQANMSLRATLSDVRRLVKRGRPDVLNFQEIGGVKRARAMRALLAFYGYAWVQFQGRNRESVPQAYRRRRFRLVKSGSWHLSDSEHVGRAGAGPATLREKSATYIVLEDRRTGRLRFFSNSHLAPSIYLPPRAALHAEQVSNLAVLAVRYRDMRRYMAGDFNTENPHRLKALLNAGLHMGRNVVTHGHNSCIDRILADGDGEFGAIGGLNSDHNALLGVFTS